MRKSGGNKMHENQEDVKKVRKRKKRVRRVRKKQRLTTRTLQRILRDNILIYFFIIILAVLLGVYILSKQWGQSPSDETTSSTTSAQ
jgi:hypothetical protein